MLFVASYKIKDTKEQKSDTVIAFMDSNMENKSTGEKTEDSGK